MMKLKLRDVGLYALLFASVLTLGWFLYNNYQRHKSVYDEKFTRMTPIAAQEGKLVSGLCQIVSASAKVTGNKVELNINGDILSGTITGITPLNELIVVNSPKLTFYLSRIKVSEDNKTELLSIRFGSNGLLLSQMENCEDIAKFVEEAGR